MIPTRALVLIAVVVGLVVGFTSAWLMYRPEPPKAETYKPAVRQDDGSLVIEKKPMPAPANPPHQIPKGGKVERSITVVVRPTPKPANGAAAQGAQGTRDDLPLYPTPPNDEIASPAQASAKDGPCPDVRVDLSLVRTPDDELSVVASSPDGTVIGGLDVPHVPVVKPKQLKWSASFLKTSDGANGGYVQRDLIGPVTVGIGYLQPGVKFASIGVRF